MKKLDRMHLPLDVAGDEKDYARLSSVTVRASSAFLAGEAALAQRDYPAALRSFERALRQAPEDPTVQLALATSLLNLGSDQAISHLRKLISNYDLYEAHLALAVAHLHLNQLAEATAALHAVLSRHAFRGTDSFVTLADRICTASGQAGWCAFDSGGRVVVGGDAQRSSHNPAIRANQVEMSLLYGTSLYGATVFDLPTLWQSLPHISVVTAKGSLLGSPIKVGAITRVEGFVAEVESGIAGWAWCPSDPYRQSIIEISSAQRATSSLITASKLDRYNAHPAPLAAPKSFALPAKELDRLQLSGVLSVRGEDGRHLYGSPLNPSTWAAAGVAGTLSVASRFPAHRKRRNTTEPLWFATEVSAPAHVVVKRTRGSTKRLPVSVIIPVYGACSETLQCIEATLKSLPGYAEMVVVNDASPDNFLVESVRQLEALGLLKLISLEENMGFSHAANVGMRYTEGRDVVLLNSDTAPIGTWLNQLREASYSDALIGTATPFSNEASLLSYPEVGVSNDIPGEEHLAKTVDCFWRANAGSTIEIPTAVGFCMFIKRACIREVGLFREDMFAQGYGEENDFCIRARHLGWRNVAAADTFVFHLGSRSFSGARASLIARNLKILNMLHPGYDEFVSSSETAINIALYRRRVDVEVWKAERIGQESVLLITHNRKGGVEKRVYERAAEIEHQGASAIIITPSRFYSTGGCSLKRYKGSSTVNLQFSIPDELDLLSDLMLDDRVVRAEVHHLVGHNHGLVDWLVERQIPYAMIVHDYSAFCPRLSLVDGSRRYCGEPSQSVCEACISNFGALTGEDLRISDLLVRSRREFMQADGIVVPSGDVSSRLGRHFQGLSLVVKPWENDDSAKVLRNSKPKITPSGRRIVIVGAIGVEKGYDVILNLAENAVSMQRPNKFLIVGYTCDDKRLLDTGLVEITGPYFDNDLASLIAAQDADFAFLPSICPETWSYSLSASWRSGLKTAAFDLGTPAYRIRSTGAGWLFPLGISAGALNIRFETLT